MTLQQIYIDYLVTQYNAIEVLPSKSRKYKQFVMPQGNTYWLGSKGGIRCGRILSNSISINESIVRRVKLKIDRLEKVPS